MADLGKIIHWGCRQCMLSLALGICLGLIAIVVLWQYDLIVVLWGPAWRLSWQQKTSALSVTGIIAIPASLIIKWTNNGWEEMKKHLVKHLLESVVPAILAVFALFCWEFFFVAPNNISDGARLVTINPKYVPPPSPPPFALRTTPPRVVEPKITLDYKIMPFEPPYAPGTTVAGISFRPQTLDVRILLSVLEKPIKNLDFEIKLINTSGQMLSILDAKQRTTYS
jgi:hypothetical protein